MDGIKLTLILLIDPTPFGQLRNNLRALAVFATSVKSLNTVCNDSSDCYVLASKDRWTLSDSPTNRHCDYIRPWILALEFEKTHDRASAQKGGKKMRKICSGSQLVLVNGGKNNAEKTCKICKKRQKGNLDPPFK